MKDEAFQSLKKMLQERFSGAELTSTQYDELVEIIAVRTRTGDEGKAMGPGEYGPRIHRDTLLFESGTAILADRNRMLSNLPQPPSPFDLEGTKEIALEINRQMKTKVEEIMRDQPLTAPAEGGPSVLHWAKK